MNYTDLKSHRNDLAISISLLLVFLAGSWSLSLVLPFALAGLLIWVFRLKNQDRNLSFTAIDLSVFAVLAIELATCLFSIYRSNSLAGLEKIYFWLVLYSLLRLGFRQPVVRTLFALGLTGYSLFLVSTALGKYMSLDSYLKVQGWSDISEFKGFLNYFKLLLNNWATLAVCLLPFPLITAVQHRNMKVPFYGALLIFCLSVLAVLISFSRGAYLSLLLFGFLVPATLILIKKIPAKTLMFPGLFTAGALALIFLLFYRPVMNTLAMNKTASQQRSTHGRLNILESGLCKAKIYWLTGTGTHNYPLSPDNCMQEQEDSGYSVYTNNLYLQILIEKGLPGLLVYGVLFFLILLRFFKKLLRLPDQEGRLVHGLLFAGFSAYAFRELFFSSFFESAQVLVFVALFAALAATGNPAVLSLRRYSSLAYTVVLVGLLFFSAWFFRHKLNGYSAGKNVEYALAEWKKKNPSFGASITKAIKQTPSILPYHELAGLSMIQDSLSIRNLFKGSLTVDPGALSTAKSHFLQALQLNPSDAGLHFNLGVLEFLQAHNLAGIPASHFIQALEREPNNVEFITGFGMLAEYTGNIQLAYQLYQKAIQLDPEILDSEFFSDLMLRRPDSDSLLTVNAIAALKSKTDSAYNVIYLARLARILMAKSDTAGASPMLQQVIRDIPVAHRPYLYLGQIAEGKGDSSLALDLYRKSFFLGKQDYLAPLALGNYYYSRMASSKNMALSAARYYRIALVTYLAMPSLHHQRAEAQYKISAPIVNDILFKDLMYYTRSRMDFKALTNRMAEAYVVAGNAEMAKHYRELGDKDLMEVELR